MALPTTEHPKPPTPQPPTPGVGMQGAPPVVEPLPPAEPVLWADIDPVLLIRLYPHAKDAAELRACAMEAGAAAREAGLELVASQQEPVVGAGEEPAPRAGEPRSGPPTPRQPPPGMAAPGTVPHQPPPQAAQAAQYPPQPPR